MEKELQIFDGKLKPCNDGQKALLILISKKFKTKSKIEYHELKNIYQSNVQRVFGWDVETLEYNPDTGEHDIVKTSELVPYDEGTIAQKVQDWTLRAIGALVRKGYLTVLPTIDFASTN